MSKITDLLQSIKSQISKIFGNKVLQLPEPENKTNKLGGLKPNKNPLKEGIKYDPNQSYKDRLSSYINDAKNDPMAFSRLSGEDLEKLLVGAVLEEKGVSKEFMKLFTNTELFSADPKYWESHLSSNFSTFVVPESYYEKTLDGISERIEELEKSIGFIGDAMYTVSSEYTEHIKSSLLGSSENTTTKTVFQSIALEPNRPEVSSFMLRTSYETVPNYLNNSPQSLRIRKSEIATNTKVLIKLNGEDSIVKETYSSEVPYDIDFPEQGSKNEYCYTITRDGDTAKICINPDSIYEVNTPLYVQSAPKSLLDTNKGLGWFEQNTNARQLSEGQITPKDLYERLKSQGLSPGSHETDLVA